MICDQLLNKCVQRQCTSLWAKLRALAARLIAAVMMIITSTTISQTDEWQREFQYYENEVNSECFIRIIKPHHLAMGYRLDGTAFLTFGIGSELGRKILPPETSNSIDVQFRFDDAPSYSGKLLFDESQGNLYAEAKYADDLHEKFKNASIAQFQFKERTTGNLVTYDIPTNGLAEAVNSIAYCDPNRSRFDLSAQERAYVLLQINTFRHFSHVTSVKTDIVLAGLAEEKSLAALVKDGRIKVPHDCLPEHRLECFHVLQNTDDKDRRGFIGDWGEWEEVMKPGSIELNTFIENHIQAAWNAGFPLFKYKEIQKMDILVSRFANGRKCELGYTADNSPLTDVERAKACQQFAQDKNWLNSRYCYSGELKTWTNCRSTSPEEILRKKKTINRPQAIGKLNLENTPILMATCITLESAVIGASVTGFGGQDKLYNFNVSVEKDGPVLINGQRIKPKYSEINADGSFAYVAIPAPDLSIALGGALPAARQMPDVSNESANALAKALRGMAGIAFGGRDRVFLINLRKDSFLFGDVVNGNITNTANARCE